MASCNIIAAYVYVCAMELLDRLFKHGQAAVTNYFHYVFNGDSITNQKMKPRESNVKTLNDEFVSMQNQLYSLQRKIDRAALIHEINQHYSTLKLFLH